jgi:pantoate--beta-alanine ligase
MDSFIAEPLLLQQTADALRGEGKRIAVVPTMGALHEGHLSLIRIARERADVVITTLFVNPAQFGPGEDLARYPRDLARDRRAAAGAGTDILFAPEVERMYPPGFGTYVNVERLTETLEGRIRPGHFRGVTTVVAKLFLLSKPHVAVFGQKDAQQLAVIRRMVHDLQFDVDIVVGPIVRERDGLAMSSRNTYLTPVQRAEAPVLHRALLLAEARIAGGGGERRAQPILGAMRELIEAESSGRIDYLSIADEESLEERPGFAPGEKLLVSLAVRFGQTRLIDNITVVSA